MDINIKQELVFKIEDENQSEKQKIRKKRVVKVTSENLKKLVQDRLSGKIGEC